MGRCEPERILQKDYKDLQNGTKTSMPSLIQEERGEIFLSFTYNCAFVYYLRKDYD